MLRSFINKVLNLLKPQGESIIEDDLDHVIVLKGNPIHPAAIAHYGMSKECHKQKRRKWKKQRGGSK